MVLFVGVQLALSVFSQADYPYRRRPYRRGPGAERCGLHGGGPVRLPYWFWGLVCGGPASRSSGLACIDS